MDAAKSLIIKASCKMKIFNIKNKSEHSAKRRTRSKKLDMKYTEKAKKKVSGNISRCWEVTVLRVQRYTSINGFNSQT